MKGQNIKPARGKRKLNARKLTTTQRATFKAFAARLANKEGLAPKAISERWNEEQVDESTRLSPHTVFWYLKEMRRAHLAEASDATAELTSRSIAALAAVATFDPRSVIDDKGNMKELWELNDQEARALGIVFETSTRFVGGEEVESSSKTKVEAGPRIQAATALLKFFHGTTVTVNQGTQILEAIQDDPEALRQITAGADPVEVITGRYRQLKAWDRRRERSKKNEPDR
jgi:hypothetical protein